MNTQDTFQFAQTHEWADLETDGLVWVGISHHAQEALGDVMFFQAPKLGQHSVEVLREAGLSDAAIDVLQRLGVTNR